MKIYIYSKKSGKGWVQGGDKIKFDMNFFFENEETKQRYYTLTFEYRFEYSDDKVYFAYHKPYKYT